MIFMSETRDPTLLFTDPSKVKFLLCAQEPSSDIPYMDMDFEFEGDPRSQACLTYDFINQSYYGQIRQSETDEGMFEYVADVTKRQLEILLEKLPEARKDRITELQVYFNENKEFPAQGPKP
jgi:hypothetical protein